MKCYKITALLVTLALLGCQPTASVEVQKTDLAASVSKPHSVDRTVYVPWSEDCTEAIQWCLDQAQVTTGRLTVVFRYVGKPYITEPLFPRSNTAIKFDPGVELHGKRGCFHGRGDHMFSLRELSSVIIEGYGATLWNWGREQTNTCNYPHSEWRMGIYIGGCEDITVRGLTIKNFCGSGIGIATRLGKRKPPERISIVNVKFAGNYREAIFVSSVRGLLIDNCDLNDTAGHGTQAGLDIEPNLAYEEVSGIRVVNCRATGNNSCGYLVYLNEHNETSPPVDIMFENCYSTGNRRPTPIVQADNGLGAGSKIAFKNCTFVEKFPRRIDDVAQYDECVWAEMAEEITR